MILHLLLLLATALHAADLPPDRCAQMRALARAGTWVQPREVPRRAFHWDLTDVSPRFFETSPAGITTEAPPPNHLFMANIGYGVLGILTPGHGLPPIAAETLPGPKSHENVRNYIEVYGNRRTTVVGMNQVALLTRPKPDSPFATEAPSTLITSGFHGCAGLMLEGSDFVLVSHFFSVHHTPPSEMVPFLLREIGQLGLGKEGIRARVIGGSDRSPNIAYGLIHALREQKIEIVETDILGNPDKATHERRSFGYSLGPTGPPEAFRLSVEKPKWNPRSTPSN